MKYLKPFIKYETPVILGIEIDVHEVKIVQLTKFQKGYKVLKAIKGELPFGSMRGKSLRDIPIISEKISSLLKEHNISTRQIITGVPGIFVITKIIYLDATLSLACIEQHILAEAEQYFEYPSSELCIDFCILNACAKDFTRDANRLMVQIVAAKKVEVESRLSALRKAGLSVVGIEVEEAALERIVKKLLPPEVAFVYVEKNNLFLSVSDQKSEIIFSDTKNIILHELSVFELEKEIKDLIRNYIDKSKNVSCQKILIAGGDELLRGLSFEKIVQNKLREDVLFCEGEEKIFNLPVYVKALGLSLWHFMEE